MGWDENKSASRCTRMWFRLGKVLERQALDQAERNNPINAIECARRADVCFWMATGAIDSIQLKDVVQQQESPQ